MALTILLVDDDPLMHRMLVPRLQGMATRPPVGRVLTATAPEAALQLIPQIAPGPLAVVADYNLKSVVDGAQLLRRVRDLRPDALRVLFSGYSLEQLGDVRAEGGADAFLEKPLLLDDLVRPLARLIEERLGG